MVYTNFCNIFHPLILPLYYFQSDALLHLHCSLLEEVLYSIEVFAADGCFERVVLFPVKQCNFSQMM